MTKKDFDKRKYTSFTVGVKSRVKTDMKITSPPSSLWSTEFETGTLWQQPARITLAEYRFIKAIVKKTLYN